MRRLFIERQERTERGPLTTILLHAAAGLVLGAALALLLYGLFAHADCGASGISGLLCGFGMVASILVLPLVEVGARLWGLSILSESLPVRKLAAATLPLNCALAGALIGAVRSWWRARR